MQGSYSLFSDDLKVIHLAPNYHRQPLSSCSYPILCANIRPVVFDKEEISMFIGVALLYAGNCNLIRVACDSLEQGA